MLTSETINKLARIRSSLNYLKSQFYRHTRLVAIDHPQEFVEWLHSIADDPDARVVLSYADNSSLKRILSKQKV